MIDGGHDASTTPLEDTGVDAASLVDTNSTLDMGTTSLTDANLAPDMGLAGSWDSCNEAVVFGADGEACSFTGTCHECVLTPSPRIALCMSGRLRVTAAGSGVCTSAPDSGMTTFPDAGPRIDAGAGVDGGACNAFQIATPTTPACPMSVVDCIRGGTDIGTCVSANAACLSCVQTDIQACATQTAGCDDEAGRARCCFQTNCPDASCSATTCATPWNAYTACVQAATMCQPSDACFPVSPTCQALTWPAPTMVSCTAATVTCINAATTDAAFQACLDNDTTTPAGACNGCFFDAEVSCVTDMGLCTSELGNVQCCTDSHCPTGDAACVQTALATGGACATVWNGFNTCWVTAFNGFAAGACADHISICTP